MKAKGTDANRLGTCTNLLATVGGVAIAGLSLWISEGSEVPVVMWLAVFNLGVALFYTLYFVVKRSSFDILSPNVLFVVFHSLYSLSVPINWLLSEDQNVNDAQLYAKTLMLSLLALISFLVSFHWPSRGQEFTRMASRWSHERARVAAWVCIGIGVVALLLFLSQVGGLQLFLSVTYSDRYLLERNMGYLTILMPLIELGALVLIYVAAKSRKKSDWIKAVLVASLFSVYMLSTGRRRAVFNLILSGVLVIHYLVRPFRRTELLGAGAIGLAFFSLWGRIRAFGNLSDGWAFGWQSWSLTWLNPANTEFGAAYRSLIGIAEHVPKNYGFKFGLSYVEAWIILIPGFLFPNRPLAPSQWFASTFYPDVYNAGGGFGMMALGEAYLNFGYLGPVLVFSILGRLVRWMSVPRDAHADSRVLLFAGVMPWVPFLLRSDFASVIKGFGVGYLLPLLVVIWVSSGADTSMKGEEL